MASYFSILSGQQIDNFESRIANLEGNNVSQLGAVATEDIVPLSKGGTGINANEASDVRVALGLGAASVYDVIPIANGGTGISANSVTDIRTGLGLGTMATQNADNYISKSILSSCLLLKSYCNNKSCLAFPSENTLSHELILPYLVSNSLNKYI